MITPAAKEIRARLVAIASAEVGAREEGGSNRGPRIREYQSATWKSPGPWPWCAAFVAWCLKKWLEDPEVRQALEAPDDPFTLERWRFREPGARLLVWWARKRGFTVLGTRESLQAGDLVSYDFAGKDGVSDHCGIVAADEDDSGEIETIEGNTDPQGSREGDGVWRRLRRRDSVFEAIRLERTGSIA